jgi:D-alanyl-lipoteichoic acid acyltransferase DltB (MBOAT superfamily)
MTFASLEFVFFFPIVVALYWLTPSRMRWLLLLVASCAFYMAFIPQYILILFALIAIDYTMAILIERSQGAARFRYLLVSIISTVGILFVFKYFNFFAVNVDALAAYVHWHYSIAALSLVLPLGLSFHTFQSLSYVIEVYRGKYRAERNLGLYALYVMFFPQLIAGPIERPQHLLPQLHREQYFRADNVISGLRLMGWGFFKKLVIADRLSISVDYVWAHLHTLSGLSLFAAMIFFAFELYADFSGYSDIARGSARVLGIDIMRNFDRPFFSTSIAEFWRRWHISLSTWFRDYVFFPLTWKGRAWGRVGEYGAILVTFSLVGLWHGAGWTFLFMGLLQGIYIISGRLTSAMRDMVARTLGLVRYPTIRKRFAMTFTFLLMSASWVFFRAPSFADAFNFFLGLTRGWDISLHVLLNDYFLHPFATLGLSRGDIILGAGALTIVFMIEALEEKIPLGVLFNQQPLFVRTAAYTLCAASIVFFGVFVSKQFIYFQF